MKKNIIALGSIVVLVLIGGVWLYTNKNNSKPLQIVALFPLTGGLASYGEPAQKAAQLAVEDINARGGIKGKKLEVIYQDHQCDPKTALSIGGAEKNSGQSLQ